MEIPMAEGPWPMGHLFGQVLQFHRNRCLNTASEALGAQAAEVVVHEETQFPFQPCFVQAAVCCWASSEHRAMGRGLQPGDKAHRL